MLEESSLADIAVFTSEILWGQSLFAFEGPVEVGNAAEPAGDGDVGDGCLGIDEQAGGVPQPDIVEEIDEVDAGLRLEKAAEGGLRHIHQFGCFRQSHRPVEISVHKIDQLFHPPAVHIDIVGIVDLFSRQRPGAGSHGQLVQNGHQLQHGVKARLEFEFFEHGSYPLDRIAGEEDAFQGLLEQAPDSA